jgi:hypothetical protein
MSRELRLSIKRQKRIMPGLPFSEDAVAALLDPFAEAEVRRLGPGRSWDVVGATLAGHAAAGGAGAGIWSRVLAEFTEFVCTESSRYADLRAEWDDLCSRSAAVAVTALTASLAAHLGVATTVVGPLIVWLVLSAVRIGTRAFCDVRQASAVLTANFSAS